MSILLVKNLSGEFNDENIGHEVINMFKPDNSEYCYFYIPPYGSIGSVKKDFYKKSPYVDIDLILVFDDTNITNILKLRTVILNPIKFKDFEEMKKESKKIKFNGKALYDIDFGDKKFILEKKNNKFFSNDLSSKDMYVYLLSYKINENDIYDFEKDNIFIWHKSNNVRNRLKDESIEKLKLINSQREYKLYELDNLIIGQKQYVYRNLEFLKDFYDNYIHPMLEKRDPFKLNMTPTKFEPKYKYSSNNFLKFVRKENDENYYSNYIYGILNANEKLMNKFFKYLIDKLYCNKKYVPSNVGIEIQYQSLIEPKKIANKYLKFKSSNELEKAENQKDKLKNLYGYDDSMIESLQVSIDGQMDLYLYDDNYRIVIENKILSGLNGKHDDISEDINQLVTYRTFLDDLNRYNLEGKSKENKVIILCQYCLKEKFSNYIIKYGPNNDDHIVPCITYRELSDFFSKNSGLVVEKYRNDFVDTINKQALSREELITYRFLQAIKK